MSVDLFSRSDALKLLHNKQVWFFGDSNTRSIYKDLVWLLENGTVIPQASLKTKNELTHANDFKTSNCALTSGRDYEETREYYNAGTAVSFTFVTKVFSAALRRTFDNKQSAPHAVIFNSCVWDLSRWGPNGVAEFKKNVVQTMQYFKKQLPSDCLVIFTTTLPLSAECRGGFLKPEVEFLRYQLPWHVIEANNFLAEMARLYKFDVLDLHYNMRFLREEWSRDGIHWSPLGYRLITNLLLTHLALSFNVPLPGVYGIDEKFIETTQKISVSGNGAKRKEIEVADSNKAKKPRLYSVTDVKCDSDRRVVVDACQTQQVAVVETIDLTTDDGGKQTVVSVDLSQIKQSEAVTNANDSFVQTKEIVTLDLSCNKGVVDSEMILTQSANECNNVFTETKQVNAVSEQLNVETKQSGVVKTIHLTTSLNDKLVETKPIVSVIDLSQIKQSEAVVSKQSNETVTNENDSFVQTKEVVTLDLSSNKGVVDSEMILTQSASECNNVFTETKKQSGVVETIHLTTNQNDNLVETKPIVSVIDLSQIKQVDLKQLNEIETDFVETKDILAPNLSCVREIVDSEITSSQNATNNLVGADEHNNESTATKQVNVVPDNVETKQLDVVDRDATMTDQGDNFVETKAVVSVDLSQTKLSEVIALKQLNESVTNFVETKEIASLDLSPNKEIVDLETILTQSTNNNTVDLDECNNASVETKQLNVAPEQWNVETKQPGVVETKTDQSDNLVEPITIVFVDLSQTKQPEAVALKQLNVVSDQNDNFVETKAIVTSDLFEVVDSETIASQIPTNSLVDSECECNIENNIKIVSEELNVSTEIEINDPVVVTGNQNVTETKDLYDDNIKIVGNSESMAANKEIVITNDLTPRNKDLNSIKTVCVYEPFKTNALFGGHCFNKSIEAAVTVKNDSSSVEFIEQNLLNCDVEQTKKGEPLGETKETCQPASSPNSVSQESVNFADLQDFSKDSFGFTFFIEKFSPQLEPLK